MKKKTHAEFLIDFQSKQPELFSNTEIISEYVNRRKNLDVACKICGYRSFKSPQNLLKGSRCQKCYKVNGDLSQRYSHEHFMENLAENTDILSVFEIVGRYTTAKSPIEVKCLTCGMSYQKKACSLSKGLGCKRCAVVKSRLTESEILEGISRHFTGYKVVTPFSEIKSDKQQVEYTCSFGHKCKSTLNSLLRGHGCRVCAYEKQNHSELLIEVVSKMPNIKLVGGSYKNSRSKMLFECDFHGMFEKRADAVLYEGKGCPTCSSANCKHYSPKLAERNREEFLNRKASIYVLWIEGVGTKVGISVNVDSRVKQIQNQSGKTVTKHFEKQTNLYDAILIEDRCLTSFNRKHIPASFAGYTEMLDCSPEELIEFINKA